MSKDVQIVGLLVARDEEKCIEYAIETAAPIIDQLIFINHASIDRTSRIVGRVCKRHHIKLHYHYRDSNHTLEYLRAEAWELGRELNPDFFHTIDGDMIFTNQKMVRKLAEKGEFDTSFLDQRVEKFALLHKIAPSPDKSISSFWAKLVQKGLISDKGEF